MRRETARAQAERGQVLLSAASAMRALAASELDLAFPPGKHADEVLVHQVNYRADEDSKRVAHRGRSMLTENGVVTALMLRRRIDARYGTTVEDLAKRTTVDDDGVH